MKRFFRFLFRLLYGFEVYNEAVLKTPGPVLLIPNHVSWLDWLFLAVCLEDDWKFVTSATTAQNTWIHRKIMVNRFTFPIDMSSPYAAKHMAEFLQKGGRLVLFAEGRISLTGALMKLYEGTGFLLHKTAARVITCYLRGAHRIPFVRQKGWTKWFARISVHFSDLLTSPRHAELSASIARKKLTLWLRDQILGQQFQVEMDHGPRSVPAAGFETASLQPRRIVLEDMNRQQLSYRRLLVGVDLLAQQWVNKIPGARGERIGVLLPNANAMPVTLLSLWAAGKIPAILNFSTGMATMLNCANLAGLKRVITSRTFIERARLDVQPLIKAGLDLIYLEDIRASIPRQPKTSALFRQLLFPGRIPRAIAWSGSDPAVVLFTSGSEGVPKGVELTHSNLMANVRQMLAVIDLEDQDRMFNALPMFHSFGLTVGTLLPLVRGIFLFLYPSPLHYRVVPAAIYDQTCTIMLATNTFLNGYARKAHPYDFRSLRYLFAGAEKVQEATFDTYARKFGVRILEGYGATECSPCVSVNTQLAPKFGSAGRLLPGIDFKLEPVEGVAEGGRLFVRGPNVMRGYLNTDANAKFQALGGWYDTGDIARVDDERFVYLLGRMKRFAKVSGEMVSLTAVEDALAGAFTHHALRAEVVVLSRPDEDKGEVLVAVANDARVTLEEIRAVLKGKGHPPISFPRDLKIIREIPKLGTGKTNHRELATTLANNALQSTPAAGPPGAAAVH